MTSSACDHQVHLYRDDDAGAPAVSSFLAAPLLRGEAVMVVAGPAHRAAFVAQLARSGVDVAAVRAQGRLVERDAAAVLAAFSTPAGLDRARFDAEVSAPVRALQARFGAVSAYGEMVGLLAARNLLATALELEGFWHDLVRRGPLRVLCGYPEDALGGPGAGHDRVLAVHDGLAPVTAAHAVLEVPLAPGAGSAARAAVRDVCLAWGMGDEDWQDDVALVVSELVGNAVRHAGSRVALGLEVHRDQPGLVVSVTDGSPARPVPRRAVGLAEDGRGVTIVAALADRWGVEPLPTGKRVWARLRPCPV